MSLSVTIITRDAASQLERCLASVAFAEEVVVVDSGSTDGTVELATRRGARAQAPRRPPARLGRNPGEVSRQAEPLHEPAGRIAARRGSPRECVAAGALALAALRQVLPVAAGIPRRRAGLGARHDRLYEQLQQVRETEGAGARLRMTILVTGGAGFIGSNFVLDWNGHSEARSSAFSFAYLLKLFI